MDKYVLEYTSGKLKSDDSEEVLLRLRELKEEHPDSEVTLSIRDLTDNTETDFVGAPYSILETFRQALDIIIGEIPLKRFPSTGLMIEIILR